MNDLYSNQNSKLWKIVGTIALKQEYEKSSNKLSKSRFNYTNERKYIPKMPSLDTYEKIAEKTNAVYDAVLPPEVEQYRLAYMGNPDSEADKTRMTDMINWCKNAEEYMDAHYVVQFRLMVSKQHKIRTMRRQLEHSVAQQSRQAFFREHNHAMEVHVETCLLSHIKGLPHELVDIIESYLPTEMVFTLVMPTEEELKVSLSKITLSKLKKLHGHLIDREYTEKGIFRTRRSAVDQKLMPFMYSPYLYGYGPMTPKIKIHYIQNIIGQIKTYHRSYNTLMVSAGTPGVKQLAVRMREEVTYVLKFINMLTRMKKPRRAARACASAQNLNVV
jgi:hypothetical protein